MSHPEAKTISEYIIDVLRQGYFLRTPAITEMVAQASGRQVRIQDVSSVLTKITSYKISDLACLIEKKKTHRGYAYRLVDEAMALTPAQIYDLSRKTRKNNQPRFTLDQAVSLYPQLKKHVNAGCRANRNGNGKEERLPVEAGHTRRMPAEADRKFSRVLSALLGQERLSINLNLYVCVSRTEEESIGCR